jgi:hypothetical protein
MTSQCAIPVFDGLFETYNNTLIMDLLFELTMWHALAKLRLHTESTVRALETSTTRLGVALRKFQSTICAEFVTRDLPSEEAARGRRKAAKVKLKPPKPSKGKETEDPKGTKKKKSTLRVFNFSCYKPHSLGDYARTIRLFGSSDGYSTQTVCILQICAALFTDSQCRGSWNIDAVNGFILASTRACSSLELPEKFAVNASSNSP